MPLLLASLVLALSCAVVLPTVGGETVSVDLSVTGSGLSWSPSPSAVAYDVLRGDVNALIGSSGDFTFATRECLSNDLGSLSLSEAGVPVVGHGYWYIVRGVPLGGSLNETYDEGGAQAGSRDAEIAAATGACPDVDLEEQKRAASMAALGTTYPVFLAAVLGAGHSPLDNSIEAGNGSAAASFQTPGWLTLHHGPDKADDVVTILHNAGTSTRVLFVVTQQQLDPNSGPPALSFIPPASPVGTATYRDQLRTLERSYATSLSSGQAMTIEGVDVRSIGLTSVVSSNAAQVVALGVSYQVLNRVPAFFLGGTCDAIPKPCYVCGAHYGCLSTEPKCLPTMYSVCYGYWVEEDKCGCFP